MKKSIKEELSVELESQETMNDLQEVIQSTTFLSLLLFMSFLLLLNKLITTTTKLNLPPSPPKLPIIGNIHQLGSLPHRSLRALSEKYGLLMVLQLGGNPTLVVSSAEQLNICSSSMTSYPATSQQELQRKSYSTEADLGFSPYGDFYKQARKICVHELLSLKKVQFFQFVREEETAASRCVLGRRVEEGDGRSEYGELTRKLSTHFTAFSFGDLYRSLEWLDHHLTGLVAGSKSTAKAWDGLLDKVLEEHKLASTTVDDDEQLSQKDFVDILLQVQKDEKLDPPLTQDNIKAVLLDMFVGATDSIATKIEWLMTELVRNPDIMKKAQEEVRRILIVGKESKVDIHKMTYLECVLKETLRLHPVSPLLPPRKTSASFEFGNYHIPANTVVLVNAYAIQTDPKSWERPEEFLPERFEKNKVGFQGDDFHLIPFGAGRRSCPGMNFGVAHVKFVTANLLYWFDWKSCKDLDMGEVYAAVVSRKTPLVRKSNKHLANSSFFLAPTHFFIP